MKLPNDFLFALRTEDDWSFVIKASVFLEALLSHSIAASLLNPKVAVAISRLCMRDKIRLASALELIGPDGVRFLNEMSAVRNTAAHDICSFAFNFTDFFENLDTNRRKSFVIALAYFASEEDIHDRLETVQELVLSDAKQAIWWSLLHFAGIMWWKKEKTKLETLTQLLQARTKENG